MVLPPGLILTGAVSCVRLIYSRGQQAKRRGEGMLEKVYKPGDIEKRWSGAWSGAGIFKADPASPDPGYCIILPPPNVTGMLTVGHALGTTVQDILCRWKRMTGHEVLWQSGTDHAGIATQNVVERSLAERGTSRIELGREKFLEECWRWKELYHGRIVEQLGRLGASLDWSREVFTLDPGVSRAVREVFVRLHEKGLIYRGRYIVNWCPRCGTAISDEEVEFREEDSKLWYIAYPFADGTGEVVVGTTRPETMLGDVAVAMSPLHERAKGLEGRMVRLPLTGREIPVILDEAVDPEFGTGFLKVTPAHDATDFEIGLRHGLDPFVVIGSDGMMNEQAGDFTGMDISAARKAVLGELEKQGLLRKTEDYRHAVGHHDRCGNVIEPYVSKQWFLRMESLAAPAIASVKEGETVFFPERWRNIYLSWMEGIRDWCISRQLWWGHRIPVWYCGACGVEMVAREDPSECAACGSKDLRQDEDVLDTWFSSWLWTFSPMGWPDQTAELRKFHPTDVLVTGGDIIFFWVARMIMASIEFMEEIPFSDVYITGIVRDAQGRKMSKSLGNSPDMIDIIDRHGADAFRFSLMMLSPPGQDLLFDEKKVEVGQHFANKIWNAARFVLSQEEGESLFAGGGLRSDPDCMTGLFEILYGAPPSGSFETGWEDHWIASRLAARMEEYSVAIGSYRFDEAARTIYEFFWHEFCDWYLEFSKPALRGGGDRAGGAALTARTVLGASMVMLHPVMPFISEEIWSMLSPGAPLLAGFHFRGKPAGMRDAELDADVSLMMEIVTAIRNIRQSFNIPYQKELSVVINTEQGSGLCAGIGRFESQIMGMAGIGDLVVEDGAEKPAGSAAAGLTRLEIYVPLGGIVDLGAERERFTKEIEKLGVECAKIGKRLEDEKFTRRAPADVVARERERFGEMEDRRRRLERILEDLA
jgi:valyl-tRNA synthetase